MFLFFYESEGLPWQLYLMFFGLLTCPVFGSLGINYLIRKKYHRSSLLLSFIILFVFFVFCRLINLLPTTQMNFLVYLSVPFGFAATAVLGVIGLSALAGLIGIIFNFLTIFGIVNLIEKKFR